MSKRAVSLHVALGVFVPGFVALTWWQAARALAGNTLSWVYTFEWPIFAGYALYMWWKLLLDEPVPGPGPDEGVAGLGSEPEDEALTEYNRYLAELNASGRQKRW
jgi:hypothetical protein